ncbi:DNA primase TraC [Methyloglobulus morosus KoM1]|uniref:DNA primase TraC n=1 Tax=Methyloglobulus morosus KoM1 TaxID=1116472 RepID=V5C4I8_9GAMM|nr:strawberry notch family protein [Methyloglobulus morosus]ESS71653.1 DNA primase TraC [Methyloglobulus morosus KoM1]
MAKTPNPDQVDLFDDWLVVEDVVSPSNNSTQTIENEDETGIVDFDKARYQLALSLADQLDKDGEITMKSLTEEANLAFGGTQPEGVYSTKDAYDAMEAAFNIHLIRTENADFTRQNAAWANNKAAELTIRIQKLPTQTKRDEEMDEFQQFSTPPALAFVANWVANVKSTDAVLEPSAGTGDLAVWSQVVGAEVILNELSPRRQTLLAELFPKSLLYKENAEQLDNVLPSEIVPSVVVMNPPFSSTAGRVQGQRDTSNGARHIEQALKRLQDGGRLVAIVGQGMAADRPAFKAWWSAIEKKYTVRANIGISGKDYAKYGTTFDNQILVIDKTGATTQPILTGYVESVAELPQLLEGIKNDHQQLQPSNNKPTSDEDTQNVSDSLQPDNRIGGVGTDSGSIGSVPVGHGGDNRTRAIDSQTVGEPPISDVVNDGSGIGGDVRTRPAGLIGGSGSNTTGGNRGLIESNELTSITIEAKQGEVTEFSDAVFSNYTPQRLTIPGAQKHPGKLVQSAAMSAVEPPPPTYAPKLPADLIQDGLLSIAQLECLVYAGQAHSELLPNGSRKGFFIGDGTGVGKGREISGIILENLMQGRKKAVWVSFNEGLIEDAKRDFAGIGGNPLKLFFQGKTKAGNSITQHDGILFTTYSTLRGGEKKQANDLGQTKGKTRAQQIIDWLGDGFDGVIAFDEAHSMGNAIGVKGKRGNRKPSQQALAGINLQRKLPNARVVYVSATGATEISNLSYADRLGLWGEGTPFADVNTFIADVSKGGIASMELISRDMKAMGMYIARSLSYDGVSYERLEHKLSEFQEDIYNELAGAWQIVLNNVDAALEITQAGSNGNAKSAALAQFWGTHQRFFNQVITSLQTPRVIEDIRRQLEVGNVAIIQLVNTNEAAQERIIADATAQDAALEDLDFTPRQMLMDYVRNGFPVAAYQESTDDNGNKIYVPVLDSDGNQVFDREAIGLRDSLLETLNQIRVPENPLDSIINSFGTDVVAEVTGRSRRFVQTRDDDGNLKVVEEKRGKHSSRADAEAFQNDKKKILVFSGAGGTGYSFHADNTAENKRKRIHYILQPGWRADSAVQGFGRTHRTNQAQEPHYVLPTTNLKAQKRFVSSIARRLDQLGALTRGQREATGQGMFTAADNLESEYATTALNIFFGDLYRGATGLSFQEVTKQMGLNLFDSNGSFCETKIPAIPQFLNRLLSLKTGQQNAVFDEFEKRLIEAVEYAKQHGLYDSGLQTLKAVSIQKTRDDVAYEDKASGAQTRYVELAVTTELYYYDWAEALRLANKRLQFTNDISGWFVSEYGKHQGDVFYLKDIGERINTDGKSVRRGVIYAIKKDGHSYIDNADVIHRGWDYRTVSVNNVNSYQKVTLSRAIDEAEAEELWTAQVARAPKTETKTTRMIVGVILPIWDRVEGSEKIYRLQTEDGEMLLGRFVSSKSAKQTLKNLGLESNLSNMTAYELFIAIKDGNKAILSNGWEISTAKVSQENRIEIKGRSYLAEAEKRVLKDQGAFIERINWQERVFIPTGGKGLETFERITQSKPVVDLIEKNRNQEANSVEQEYGVPKPPTTETIYSQANGKSSTDIVSIFKSYRDNPQEVMPMNENKKAFHETVAENLIRQLEQGTAPWQRPWEAGESGSFVPFNPLTGNRYKGINALQLMSQERGDQRWMTYKQASELGGQVRRGEKGTTIQYWKFTEQHIKKDEDGKTVLDDEGNPVKITVKLERPRVFYATVFNADQIDGLPPLQKKEQTWDAIERAEAILSASGALINHSAGGRAFYRPSSDSIYLPEKGQFLSADKYYVTALHELGHWTGHESRLNRDLAHPFGSEGYATEELRAEISSMLLGDTLGIGHDPEQHTAYVGSWIKTLRDDPLEIFRAAADAEKIQAFVLGLEQEQMQTQKETANQAHDQQQNEIEANLTQVTESIFTTLPKDLSLLSSATAADYEEAVNKARIENRTYLQVPYQERNQAKELGAKWDREIQSWYAPANVDISLFSQWPQTDNKTKTDRQYLAVPYTDRNIAKEAGAMWDKNAKSWYIGDNANMGTLSQWLPAYIEDQQTPALTPQQEFTDALASLGCLITGEHPIMDGQTHRIATEGDKPGERAGFYVAYLDGHPAGYIQNNRTGDSLKWKAKGYTLSETEKAQLQANNAVKLQEREAALKAKQDAVAHAVRRLLVIAPPAPADHPYLQLKQVRPGNLRVVPEANTELPIDINILIGKNRKESQKLRKSNPEKLVFTAGDLLLPAIDSDGDIRSLQSIQGNGIKRFAPGGEKQNTFHVAGGQGLYALALSPTIIIGEGYATVDTLSQALGFPTIAAFDSGNLPNVARLLREKFPNKPIIIAGDNDLHLELTEGRNPGKEKAHQAATLVNGTAIFPIFAQGEQTYPATLSPVTPEKARKGELSDDQKTAIAKMKNFTDFNDLATKSAYGMGGVEQQVINLVNRIIAHNLEQIEFKHQQTYNDKIEQQHVKRRAM